MMTVEIREGYVPGFVGRSTDQHARYYGRLWELGPRFEVDIAEGIAEFVGRYDPSRDGIWTAVDEGDVVRGGIVIDGRDAEDRGAQLRYFILDPELHGKGFGRLLLERAVAFCDAQDYRRVFLWTVDELEAAIHLYRDFGFVPTDRTDVHTNWRTDVPYRLFERTRER